MLPEMNGGQLSFSGLSEDLLWLHLRRNKHLQVFLIIFRIPLQELHFEFWISAASQRKNKAWRLLTGVLSTVATVLCP